MVSIYEQEINLKIIILEFTSKRSSTNFCMVPFVASNLEGEICQASNQQGVNVLQIVDGVLGWFLQMKEI